MFSWIYCFIVPFIPNLPRSTNQPLVHSTFHFSSCHQTCHPGASQSWSQTPSFGTVGGPVRHSSHCSHPLWGHLLKGPCRTRGGTGSGSVLVCYYLRRGSHFGHINVKASWVTYINWLPLTWDRTECGKRCYYINASQFSRKAFSCLYIGLIVVRINIKNKN